MNDKTLTELSEVVQSSNLSFLLGSGVSRPFLPVLNSIETDLDKANSREQREILYKKYLTEVMLPNKSIIKNESTLGVDYNTTFTAYKIFFQSLSELILERKSTILSKQVNVFTTNIDVLLETVLEELQLEYNDGFSGKFNPSFSLANYKKSLHQRSLHFEHISELPVFNIIKIHGSLTWKSTSDLGITFSHKLDHFDDTLLKLTGDQFDQGFKKILVVNPENTKHLESVLNIYYSELLRMYSSELEKENATLFTLGFSMDDRHIKEITLRAAKSNPTLRVFVFCSKKNKEIMNSKLETSIHPNIQIHVPEEDTSFTLELFVKTVLDKIRPEK